MFAASVPISSNKGEDADQILVLDAGRIIERGTFRELLDANGKFAEMWRLQQQDAENSALQAA